MSLHVDEAFDALQAHRISDEEYVHHIFAHFNGARHAVHQNPSRRPWELMIRDPVGNAIRDVAVTAADARPDCLPWLEHLFIQILADESAALHLLTSSSSSPIRPFPFPLPFRPVLLHAIATFAALHARAHVLRHCLLAGAAFDDRNLALALEFAARTPELLDVLYEFNWRDIRHSALAFARMATWALHTTPAELGWFLDRGAGFDAAMLRRAGVGRTALVKAACVELLVRREGVGIVRATGLLQNAAKRGRDDVVRVLLDAGVEVDELLPLPGAAHRGEEGGVLTALYEAVDRQHDDTVRVLLAYGADPNREVGAAGLNTAMKLAEARGYANLAAMMHRSVERDQAGHRSWISRL